MDDETARLALPLLQTGQAQKEMTHNEALARIDVAVGASVVAIGQDVPPADPQPGQCWVVGTAPVGAWAGHADAIAGWTAAGWRFVAPWPGAAVWVDTLGVEARYAGGAWTVGVVAADRLLLGGRDILDVPVDAVAPPSGGTTIDAEARMAIDALIAALRHHRLMAPA